MRKSGDRDLIWDTVGRRAPLPSCGDDLGLVEDCCSHPGHDAIPYRKNCNSMSCRRCSRSLAYKYARSNLSRLRAISRSYYLAGYDFGPELHTMISLPESMYGEFTTLNRFKALQKDLADILLDLGHVAWAQAIHQVKGTDRQIRKYQERYIDLPLGWHTHQVGYGPTLPQTGIVESMTPPEGWHYSSSRRGDVGVWVRDEDQVVFKIMPIITSDGAMNALAYELKHAAMYQDMSSSKVVKLYGLAAYNSPASVTFDKIKTRRHCRVCSDDKDVRLDGQYVRDAYQVRKQYQAELDQDKLVRVLSRYNLVRGLVRTEDLSCLEVNHESS